jgi:VanZ family protein
VKPLSPHSSALRWRIALVLWMGSIYALTSLPGTDADTTEKAFGVLNYLVRKAAHLTEFAVLAALWYASIEGGLRRWRARAAAAAWSLASLYGLSDEVHQAFVPNRSPSGYDVVLDSAGALLGLLLLRLLRARLSAPDPAPGPGQA